MTSPVKIQLTLDANIEGSLRVHMAAIGRARKGQLSMFFEELITTHLGAWARAALPDETPDQPPSPNVISASSSNAHAAGETLTPSELASLVDAAPRTERARLPPRGLPTAHANDQAGQAEDDDTDAGSIATIWLRVRIKNNSEFVRGKKHAREHIERYCLAEYDTIQLPGGEYELKVPYSSDDDLDRTMHELLGDICIEADDRHCQCETEARMQGSDRHW